jgi:hypothetical protein
MRPTPTVLAIALCSAACAAVAGQGPSSAYDLLPDNVRIANLPQASSRNMNGNRNENRNASSNANANSNRVDSRNSAENVTSVTSTVRNGNHNSNHQGQSQGQGQGQQQGQSQSSQNRVNAGNHNGNVRNAGNNTGTSASTATQANANTSLGNTTTTNVAGDSYVQQAQQRNPVASAIPPALAAGQDTCMGSTSVGAQGVGLGVSFGNTWNDDNCVMLKNSTLLWNMGRYDAAIALMCGNDKVRDALELSGTECPQTRRKRDEASRPKQVTWDASDPYIAARMRDR